MTRLFGLLSLCMGLLILSGATGAQDKTEKPPDKKEPTSPKVVGNVSYVVVKSEVTSDELQRWTLIIEATSKRGDQTIYIANARAITPEGKTFDINLPMAAKRGNPVRLPEGIKIQLELKMGKLDKSVKAIRNLELFGDALRDGSTTIPGIGTEEGAEKGRFKKAKPLVLENVPIERQEP